MPRVKPKALFNTPSQAKLEGGLDSARTLTQNTVARQVFLTPYYWWLDFHGSRIRLRQGRRGVRTSRRLGSNQPSLAHQSSKLSGAAAFLKRAPRSRECRVRSPEHDSLQSSRTMPLRRSDWPTFPTNLTD